MVETAVLFIYLLAINLSKLMFRFLDKAKEREREREHY